MSLPAADLSKQPDNRTTMELGAVLPLTAEVKDDHLYVGGVDMVELAREQGTALYVMDEADMRTRMETYLAAFRSRYQNSDVVYASKAFLNKEAARIVADEGLCLDVSGGGELAIALAAGFPTERIFMHGNNKTPRELREAIQAGVGRIIIDSRIELRRISEIAGELGVEQPVYMRITPGVEADTHQYIRTGCEDSKFGFTMREDFAFRCVADVLATPNVRLAGLHCHIGSQIFALHSYPEAVEVMVELMARIEEGYGYRIEELDVGGGLGVNYDVPENEPIPNFASLFSIVHNHLSVGDREVHFEFGRSIVAECGELITKVLFNKTTATGRKLVIVDASMTELIRPALYGSYHNIENITSEDEARDKYTIVGTACESTDVFDENVTLRKTRRGDLLTIKSAGAYGMSMASRYNLRDLPRSVYSDEL